MALRPPVTHLRANDRTHLGGPLPAFYATACGVRASLAGHRLGDPDVDCDTLREDEWRECLARNPSWRAACKRCLRKGFAG